MNMEAELQKLRERNARVEAEKAWETSWTRTLAIALATYGVALVWLIIIHELNPFLKAFVPVLGYLLSTLSLPIVKRWWIKKRYCA